MKLLADENFPLRSIYYLRDRGVDISSIGTDNPSIRDIDVVNIAITEERTIVTFDRDFGELIFRHHHKPPQGVIYLRLDEYAPHEPGELIFNLINSEELLFDDTLTVVDKQGIRQKRYSTVF